MEEKRQVYLDNNATTRVDDRVQEYIRGFFSDSYAVASSQFSHTPGILAKEAVDRARSRLSEQLKVSMDEIVFTSGATEANNLAIKGVCFKNLDGKRKKIVISSIEHFSVLHSAMKMEKFGFHVEKVRVNGEGFLDLDHLADLVDDDTLLVSVMTANHEVGTIQDMKKIGKICKKHGALLHTDASFSFLFVPAAIEEAGIDLMSLSSHRIYGPKGAGALYVKNGLPIEKIIDGGFQEHDLRAGIENVPAIAGFGKAVELFSEEDLKKTKELTKYLHHALSSRLDGVLLNGPKDFARRLPNNLNLSFNYVEGESVVLHMDMRGVALITGSACFSRSLQASHVLLAMGFSHERAHGSIRFSPSKYLTREDMDYTAVHVMEVVNKLREISSLA